MIDDMTIAFQGCRFRQKMNRVLVYSVSWCAFLRVYILASVDLPSFFSIRDPLSLLGTSQPTLVLRVLFFVSKHELLVFLRWFYIIRSTYIAAGGLVSDPVSRSMGSGFEPVLSTNKTLKTLKIHYKYKLKYRYSIF